MTHFKGHLKSSLWHLRISIAISKFFFPHKTFMTNITLVVNCLAQISLCHNSSWSFFHLYSGIHCELGKRLFELLKHLSIRNVNWKPLKITKSGHKIVRLFNEKMKYKTVMKKAYNYIVWLRKQKFRCLL